MTQTAGVGAARWTSVLGSAVLLLLSGLGSLDAWAPDEPRYIQVAEEIRSFEHGPSGLVVLHLDGEVYDQKPPLYYWLAALCGAPLGRVTEAAARLPSALAGVALVGLTLAFGARLLGGRTGVRGAALLLTVFDFARLARRVQLDVLLALLETVALFFFWRIDRSIGARRRQLAALHGALGLAVLTKGPVGFLVPLLVMLAYLGWEGRLREIRRLLPPWALLLSLGPGLLWVTGATTLAPPGFADTAIGTNLFGRFFAGTSHARPFYYYLYQFPVVFLPWTLLWPLVALDARQRVFAAGAPDEVRRPWRLLLAWVGVTLLFFTLSAGKRGLYLVPAFPAAALLCADALVHRLAGRARLPRWLGLGLAIGAALLALVALELAITALTGRPLLVSNAVRGLESSLAGTLEQVRRPPIAAFGFGVLAVLAAAALAWAVLVRLQTGPDRRVVVAIAACLGVELAAFLLLFPGIDPLRSPRHVAVAAAAAAGPAAAIGLVGDAAMRGGLVYYGDRRVVPLETADSIRDFLASGGRTFVVKAGRLERVTAVTPVDIVTRSRSGGRELLVVRARARPAGDAAATPVDDEAHGAVRRPGAP